MIPKLPNRDIKTPQSTLSPPKLESSLDLTTSEKGILENAQKRKQQKKDNIRAAFDRPKEIYDVLQEQLDLETEYISLKTTYQVEQNKLTNKRALLSDAEYPQPVYIEDVARLNIFYQQQIDLNRSKYTANNFRLDELQKDFFGLFNTDKENKILVDKRKVRELRKKERKLKKLNKQSRLSLWKARWKNEKNKFKAIVDVISYLSTTYLQLAGAKNGEIDDLVTEIIDNDIPNISTPQDLEKVIIKKDTALRLIALTRNYLNSLNILLNQVGILNTILSAIVEILYLLPPPLFPAKVAKIIIRIEAALNDLSKLFIAGNLLVQKLLEDLDYQESRLRDTDELINQLLTELDPNILNNLLNQNTNGLGYLSGYDYKGFKFYIREEKDPKPEFVINGYKRRYAVALDTSGGERLQSEYSFTLDPDVLVEQLKVEIDKQNLVA